MKRKQPHLAARVTLLSLGITVSAWCASPVPVTNAGFENPVLSDGVYQSGVPGWTAFNGASIGIWNPDTADFTLEAPAGANTASLDSVLSSVHGISQVLSSALQADATYSLTVQVGDSTSIAGFPGYRVQLLAGGTVLAEDINSVAVAVDTFATSTVPYVYNAGLHSALVGTPLEIRLLSEGLVGGSEVSFDDVQLTVALTNPLANPGGPYGVAIPSGSLALNGSGSQPSDGQTITAYDWDLDNDGDFDEAISGVTPASISYATLTGTYGMVAGNNTIKLRVTDSAAKTSTVAGTVNLFIPPPTLTWDHNADGTASDGAGIWLDANKWLDGVTPATWSNAGPDNAIIGSNGTGGNISLAGGVTVGTATFDNYTGKYQLSNGLLTVNDTLTWGPNTTRSGTNDGVEFLSTASLAGDGEIVVNGNYPEIKESGQFNIRTSNVSAFTGTWNVQNGVLFTEGAFVPSTTSNIILNGGAGAGEGAVYSSRWGQTLTRNLGTADNQIQVIGNRSGFEGQGTSGLTVRLTDTGIGTQQVQWGTANFDPSVLILQTPNSNLNGVVNFDTAVDLNGANRTVDADLNHGNGIITGVWNDGLIQMGRAITNSSGTAAGLIKEGPGWLVLAATNTYDGGTTVNEGAVRYELAAAMPSTGTHAFSAGTMLQVRVGGGDDFTLAGTGAGSLDGLLSGTGPGTSTVTYTGDVDLMLRGSGTVAGNIPNLGGGGTTTDLWLIDGNYTLSGNNTFSGVLGVGRRGDSARTLTLGSATALAGQPTVVIDTSATSKMNLNGFNATIGQLRLGSNNGGSGGTVEDTVGGGVLTLTNGIFVDSHNDGGGRVLCETVDLNGATQLFKTNANNRANSDLIISAAIQNGGLTSNATAGQTEIFLNGANTYTGGTTHEAGRLRINGSLADATMSITGGDVAGTGALTFNIVGAAVDQVVTAGGSINITGMTCNVLGTPTVAEYVLIDATGAGSYLGTFTPGTLPPGYSLDYTETDKVKIVGTPGGSPFDIWAGTGTLGPVTFLGDTNGDDVQDGMAFLLGVANPDDDASGALPTVSEDGSGNLVMVFDCLPAAGRGTAELRVAHSNGNTLLTFTATVDEVPDADDPTPDNNVTFMVTGPSGTPSVNTVTATINVAASAGGKLFGRLEGTE